MRNFILALSLLLVFSIYAIDVTEEIVAGEFDIVHSENFIISNGKYQLADITEEGYIFSETFVSPLPHLTGYAARIKGTMNPDEALEMDFYWSTDGENWTGPINDDEVGLTHKDPKHPYIYSDFHFPDNIPSLHYRIVLYIQPEDDAKIEGIDFIFLDAGETEEQPQPTIYKAADSEECPMPAYYDRYDWGCDEAGSPSWWPSYTDAWIWAIHHTAGGTSTPSDPMATMRSIWYYHTYTNGWGDIGYQFVLDHLGNIYQGRYNSDLANLDAVGAHVGGHNTGCVGLSVMGNFETATVHDATLTALYSLVAWKCDQRGIDPYGSSWLVDGTYPNISGHRDIGSTACPGANFYALMPSIRDSVYNRIHGDPGPGGGSDTLIIDNGDPEYTVSSGWTDGTYNPSSGWEDDYQYCSVGGDVNTARWTPNIPVYGEYAVYMWWYGGSNRCDNVTVKVQGESYNEVTVSQRDVGSSWHDLGDFAFNVGTGGYVEISDESYSGDGCSVVIADAVMWILLETLGTSESPRPEMLDIRLFPNPFNSAVNIQAPEGALVEIYDMQGKRLISMISEGNILIWQPDEDIPSGTYLVRSTTDFGHIMRKIDYIK
ncbi:MAG: N-acetylmuramoyl-L-alanine amidase [Candidatus Zixiibacteriota bacterium]